MNGKHHLASGQVVITKEINNTLLIHSLSLCACHFLYIISLHPEIFFPHTVYKSVSSSKVETDTLQYQGCCIGAL